MDVAGGVAPNLGARACHVIPYGRHDINDEDIAAVVGILRSDWLTTGPAVETFEHDLVVCRCF